MRKRTFIAGALLMAWLGAGIQMAWAQDAVKPKSDPLQPGHAYRLDFTLNELEDGKKINSRQYSINVDGGSQSEIKIGSRVPVEANGKTGEFQYLDVGTNIWCRLRDYRDVSWLGEDLLLDVRSDISNFAVGDQANQPMRPIVRQVKIDANTIAIVGKQLSLGTVDDPASKRQFQLEVLTTKLR
jgi:hypothetical protein